MFKYQTRKEADRKKFKKEFKKAEKGDPYYQNWLGKQYSEGGDLISIEDEAIYWFKKAAEQNYAEAQYNLGYLYLKRTMSEKYNINKNMYGYRYYDFQKQQTTRYYHFIIGDKGEAVYWFEKAAAQGHAEANELYYTLCKELADEYYDGFYRVCCDGETTYRKDYPTFQIFLYNSRKPNLSKNPFEVSDNSGLSVEEIFFYKEATFYYEKIAAKSDDDVLLRLGICYYHMEKYDNALKWLLKIPKNTEALYYMGLCYNEKKSYKNAFECFEKCKSEEAILYQAIYYYCGSGVEYNENKAKALYKQISKKNAQLIETFSKKEPLILELKEAALVKTKNKITKGAKEVNTCKKSDIDAIMEKGKSHYNTGNYERAVVEFSSLAELNYAPAINFLGICYNNGKGVKRDYKKSYELYKQAAELGYAAAKYNMGLLYYYGNISTNGYPLCQTASDYNEAAMLFKEAADEELASAQYMLGVCYKEGNGVIKNFDTAIMWCEKSAENGYDRAKEDIIIFYEDAAISYFYGFDVSKNYKKAIELFKKANSGVGYFFIAVCYYYGYGVPKDTDKGVELYEKARSKNDFFRIGGTPDIATFYNDLQEALNKKEAERKSQKHNSYNNDYLYSPSYNLPYYQNNTDCANAYGYGFADPNALGYASSCTDMDGKTVDPLGYVHLDIKDM